MTLQPIPSEFPYIWGKFSFLFYQCAFCLSCFLFQLHKSLFQPYCRACQRAAFSLLRIFKNRIVSVLRIWPFLSQVPRLLSFLKVLCFGFCPERDYIGRSPRFFLSFVLLPLITTTAIFPSSLPLSLSLSSPCVAGKAWLSLLTGLGGRSQLKYK
jgi:hypothetical protein